MTSKIETVEEFLARGGKIEKLPAADDANKEVSVRSTAITAPTLYHLTEGQYLFGKKKKNSSKKKTKTAAEVAEELKKIRSMGSK